MSAGPLFANLFTVCDGVVAADKQPAGGPVSLSAFTPQTFTAVEYVGYTSKFLCGGTSKYDVTWHTAVA